MARHRNGGPHRSSPRRSWRIGALLTIAVLLGMLHVSTAQAATSDSATATASPGPYLVGQPITFTSTNPCTVACRLIWTYLNGTRLGDALGEGTSVTTSFSTPGLKTVELRLTENCVGTTRLVCSSVAVVSVDVQQAPPAPTTDSTAPTFALSGVEAEATGPTTPVGYTFQATDPDDAVVAQSCTPPPASAFGVGTSRVTCTATDSHGNVGTQSFDIVVNDTTAPAMTLPGSVSADATSSAGALVTYAATASDLVDGPVTPSCTPASGSVFAVGTTTVSCTATDTHGNTSTGDFSVSVTSAVDLLGAVRDQVATFHLRNRNLLTRIDATIGSFGRHNRDCRSLLGLREDVTGPARRQLTWGQRIWLRVEVARITSAAGCP